MIRIVFILTWGCMSASRPSNAQRIAIRLPDEDTASTAELYARGRALEAKDSLNKALPLYAYIVEGDSSSAEAKLLRPRMDSMLNVKYQAFLNHIKGRWRWRWSGSNWGTGETPEECACTRSMEITDSTITLRKNGQIEMVLPMRVEKRYYILWRLTKWPESWAIDTGQKDQWVVTYTEKEPYYAWQIKDPLKGPFLDVNLMRWCVCGCPQEMYEKE